MVASPNVDFGGANGLANFLQDQQRQIDEIGRRSTYPFSAGPGGTFQVYPDPSIKDVNGQPVVDMVLKYETGTPALAIKPGLPLYGSKQQMVMRDLAGTAMYRTDEVAGYGLSAPIFSYFMVPVPGISLSAGVDTDIVRADNLVYNPAWYSQVLFRNFVGVTSLAVRFAVTDGNTSVTSSTQTITGPNYVQKAVLMPESFMSNQYVTGRWYVKANVAGSVEGWPISSQGWSKAKYDSSPGQY